MADYEQEVAQEQFFALGGCYRPAIAAMIKNGTMYKPGAYVHKEYPKIARRSLGERSFQRSTETVDKRRLEWTEKKTVYWQPIVQNLEEEMEAFDLFDRAYELDIHIEPDTSIELLRHQVKVADERINHGDPIEESAILTKRIERMSFELELEKAKLAGEVQKKEMAEKQLAATVSRNTGRRNALAAAAVAPAQEKAD